MTIREYPGPEEINFDKNKYPSEYLVKPRQDWAGEIDLDKPEEVVGYVVEGSTFLDRVGVSIPSYLSGRVMISLREQPWKNMYVYLTLEELDELMLILMYAKQEMEKNK